VVEDQGHIVEVCEWYNGGGIHFDGTASKYTC